MADRSKRKYKYTITFSSCPHCGTPDTEEENHIVDGETTLCGQYDVDEENIFTDEYRFIDRNRDFCPACKRKLDDFDKAIDDGFDSLADYKRQERLDRARYEHWMQHGSLAGFGG